MGGNDARDGRETGPRTTADSDLSARLKRLEAQLDRKRDTALAREGFERSSSGPSALGRAFRLSAEFVAGIIAGGGLGWLIDRGLGTSPLGLIVFLMLGFAAGTFNVVRAAKPAGGPPTGDAGAGSKPKDE